MLYMHCFGLQIRERNMPCRLLFHILLPVLYREVEVKDLNFFFHSQGFSIFKTSFKLEKYLRNY